MVGRWEGDRLINTVVRPDGRGKLLLFTSIFSFRIFALCVGLSS